MLGTMEGDFVTATQLFTCKCFLFIDQGFWSQYAVQIKFIHSVKFGEIYEEFCGWEIPLAGLYSRIETGVPAMPLHDFLKQAGFDSKNSQW